MKTMKNIWYLNLAFIVYTAVPSKASECNYYGDQGEIFNSSMGSSKIICKSVTSEVFLHYNGESYPESMYIINSVIRVLPPNSSLSQFIYLKQLYIDRLQIEDISPGAFTGLKELKKLFLEGNKLTTVRAGVFDDLNNLEMLDLSNNLISVLEENCFSHLVKLNLLKLNLNRLSVIKSKAFVGLRHLTYLDISDNLLKELKELELPSLQYLSVYNNSLTNFEMDLSQTNIREISFQNCHLKKIDFALFPKNLVSIFLKYNELSVLQNFEKVNAETVYLSGNKLTQLEVYPRNVNTLYLDHNQIEFLENKLPQTSQIQHLFLSHNKISEIRADSFLGLNSLKFLFLDNNQITTLSKGVFVHTPELVHLNLGRNRFQDVDPNALTGLHKLNFLQISWKVYKNLNSSTFPSDIRVFSHED